MSSRFTIPGLLAALFLGALALPMACSSDATEKPNTPGSDGGQQGTGSKTGLGSTASSQGGNNVRVDLPDANTGPQQLEPDAACAGSLTQAKLTQINMVFILDKSGSMGKPDEGGDYKIKWEPVRDALKAFFQTAGSDNIYASFGIYPPDNCDMKCSCTPETYTWGKGQIVTLTELTKSQDFVDALDSLVPGGGTPTMGALRGSLDYAVELKQKNPRSRTMVVLVTDGEPGFALPSGPEPDAGKTLQPGCDGNDIPTIATMVRNFAEGTDSDGEIKIPTYVIGVGTELGSLRQIAEAGSDSGLTLLKVGKAEETKQQLLDRLTGLREVEFDCNSDIPLPDAGRLDKDKLNVIYHPGDGGDPEFLSRDEGCKAGRGSEWQYDSPAAPTQIQLCPKTCTRLKEDAKASLEMQFGCETITIRY